MQASAREGAHTPSTATKRCTTWEAVDAAAYRLAFPGVESTLGGIVYEQNFKLFVAAETKDTANGAAHRYSGIATAAWGLNANAQVHRIIPTRDGNNNVTRLDVEWDPSDSVGIVGWPNWTLLSAATLLDVSGPTVTEVMSRPRIYSPSPSL